MLYITLLFMIHRPNEDPNSKIVISMRIEDFAKTVSQAHSTTITSVILTSMMKFQTPRQGWDKSYLIVKNHV